MFSDATNNEISPALSNKIVMNVGEYNKTKSS